MTVPVRVFVFVVVVEPSGFRVVVVVVVLLLLDELLELLLLLELLPVAGIRSVWL